MTDPCRLSNRDSHCEVMQNQKRWNQHEIIAKSSESWWSTVPDHFIYQSGFLQYISDAMNNPRKSISGDTVTAILDWFYLYKDVSIFAKSIYVCTENTLNEYKYKRRIRQEYFAVCGEYAFRHEIEPIATNFSPKTPQKLKILNYLSTSR